MSDAISNYGRMAQSNAALRSAIDKVDTKTASAAKAQDEAKSSTLEKASAGADKVSLSNVAEKAMAQPDFDRAKVEAIKQAIKEGNYPINPRRIAESFVSLEKMISAS
jgi:negative regulator of flagellin synthesis FlgM